MNTRILVVDDEDSLRQLLQKYLLRLGYSVDTAANGEEAWRMFASHSESYNLALVDLSLPDQSGDQLSLRMLDSNPTLRILMCSGYPYEVEQLPNGFRARVAFLQKPFLPRQLADQLTQLTGR